MGYLANYCAVSPHFCCNDILFQNVDYSYNNDTNRVSWGEIWQNGGEKWSSCRGQLGMGPHICNSQTQLLRVPFGAKFDCCKRGGPYPGNILKTPPFGGSVASLWNCIAQFLAENASISLKQFTSKVDRNFPACWKQKGMLGGTRLPTLWRFEGLLRGNILGFCKFFWCRGNMFAKARWKSVNSSSPINRIENWIWWL